MKKILTLLIISNLWNLNALEPLDFEEAFQFSATQNENTVTISVKTAKNYYLYTQKTVFNNENVRYSNNWVNAKVIEDEFMGTTEIIEGKGSVNIRLMKEGMNSIRFQAQGCYNKGLCYLPTEIELPIKPYKVKSITKELKVVIALLLLAVGGIALNILKVRRQQHNNRLAR